MPVCREVDPPTREVAPGRWVACHLHDAAIMARPDARPERPDEAAADRAVAREISRGPAINPAQTTPARSDS
jgi:oligopeptide transport system ATP-binding protein